MPESWLKTIAVLCETHKITLSLKVRISLLFWDKILLPVGSLVETAWGLDCLLGWECGQIAYSYLLRCRCVCSAGLKYLWILMYLGWGHGGRSITGSSSPSRYSGIVGGVDHFVNAFSSAFFSGADGDLERGVGKAWVCTMAFSIKIRKDRFNFCIQNRHEFVTKLRLFLETYKFNLVFTTPEGWRCKLTGVSQC